MSELPRQSGELDINIEHGVDFTMTAIYQVNGSVIDTTGYNASFIIRNNSGSTSKLLELTESSGITVTGSLGKFTIDMTELQSAFGNRSMVYNLVIQSPSGKDIQLLRGKCQSHAQGD